MPFNKYKNCSCNDWYIELFEDFPCERKEQLDKREGELIRQIGTLNKRIEGRTQKEYREDNKEKILQSMKEYREKNKEKKKEYIKEYYKDNKEYYKQYYQNNKEKILAQKKE